METDADYILPRISNFTNATSFTEPLRYWAASLSVFVIATLFGNVLVVMAVVKTKSLNSVTNYLIASLAIADITVGAMVMPFAVYVEIRSGKFLLPEILCDAWVSLDVLACTASILSMTAISIDRFLAINHAIHYTHALKNSRWYPVAMIGLCWVISIASALPIAVGANYTDHRIPNVCRFFNPVFSAFSSIGSFFLPTVVMIILYFKIFETIRHRARASARSAGAKNNVKGKPKAPIKGEPSSDTSAPSDGTGEINASHSSENKEVKPEVNSSQHDAHEAHINELSPLTPKIDEVWIPRETQQSVKVMGSDLSHFTTEQPTSKRKRSSLCSCYSVEKKPLNGANPERCNTISSSENQSSIISSPSKRMKRDKRETKATIALLVVMCAFLFCWFPFFVANNLDATCQQWALDQPFCQIPPSLFNIFVWLGYINSTLNPAIYAMFNIEYRRAFKKLLHIS